MVGLLNHVSLSKYEGIVLESCSFVHTRGMQFNIDVLIIDRKNRVIGIYLNVKPGKLFLGRVFAKKIIELSAGTTLEFQFKLGDTIILQPNI